MGFLDGIAHAIGWTVLEILGWLIVLLIIAGAGNIVERFPRLRPGIALYARVVVLTAWGVLAIAIFVAAILFHVRERDNLSAFLATGIGIVVWVTWRRSGWPVLKRDLFPPKDPP